MPHVIHLQSQKELVHHVAAGLVRVRRGVEAVGSEVPAGKPADSGNLTDRTAEVLQ